MQPRRRARRPFATDPSPAASAPSRSAAWLAGERLFGAAAAPDAEASPVVVTIRRSKLAAAAGDGDREVAVPDDANWKGPRVYRVEPASNEAAPAAADEPPAVEQMPAALPRRQRIGVDRRPGPVRVQVFQAEPAETAAPPLIEQLATLRAAMAEVERLLAEARRAQALRFVAG